MTGETGVFLYGQLRDDDLRRLVLGADIPTTGVVLADHAVVRSGDDGLPVLVARDGGNVAGELTAPLPTGAAERLDWYLCALGYRAAAVAPAGGTAVAYLRDGACPDIWDFPAWQARFGALAREAATEVMRYFPGRSPGWVAPRWPQIHQRAAARLAARAEPAPATVRTALGVPDVDLVEARQPYVNYFAVAEHDLRFRRFDGSMSEVVTRAALVAGDAVTVLPYDPVWDAVLLVEQFRFGPWVRGDLRPWMLEPIAGRIDPGEAPEETARREAREEAGLTLGHIEKVAAYYPTTGAMSEYVTSFVGLCDLSGQAGTVSGEVGEHEDILSHVVGFDDLMSLVASGEAENAPLLLSAFWLAANRDRLRRPG